ncbi:hypothetical protein NADFUDRAFT_84524 [Nadsonia fulvescens var. elongata DSM 6958]|uniref:Uncharacterized protein n=1 Tax=Nadsonia fulvescens var. elongata DSM 6958 TaxID=857566 RepID=A0A1E3PDC1_9ASCO|nr:hypothetical protein NADFUDRAFT_84524 [Nadsonia fulvescens var. elongata DSM 6958]
MYLHLPPTSLKSEDMTEYKTATPLSASNSSNQGNIIKNTIKHSHIAVPAPSLTPTQNSGTSNTPTSLSSIPEIEICPLCRTPLRKCLIQADYALKTCPQTDCVYPFDRDSLDGHILAVSNAEILENVAKRMERANVKSETIQTIVDSNNP